LGLRRRRRRSKNEAIVFWSAEIEGVRNGGTMM
jgi:hypothetical protein